MNRPTESKARAPQKSPKRLLLAGIGLLVAGGLALLLPWGPRPAPETASLLGQPAPNFVLNDIDGNRLELYALRGEPVLLYFAATWCVPCRLSTRELARLYGQYGHQFQVVWISLDPLNDSNADLQEHRRLFGHPGFRYTLDRRTDSVALLYNTWARGSKVFINSRGETVYKGISWGGRIDPRFVQQLRMELGGS